jgi:hypothetical protein
VGEPGEALSQLQGIAVFHDHVGIRMGAAEELVSDVAADNPSPDTKVVCGLLQEPKQVLIANRY